MRTMGAARAKTQLLALLDEVEAKRESIVLTKNGRPVARVVPMPLTGTDPIFGFMKGKVKIVGDIISPSYSDEEYEEFFQQSAATLR